jgi:hypothetical protein
MALTSTIPWFLQETENVASEFTYIQQTTKVFAAWAAYWMGVSSRASCSNGDSGPEDGMLNL